MLLLASVAVAEEPRDFEKWLNDLIAQKVKVAVSTRSNANQVEAPSASTNSSSLVDTSSASDLVGLALNLAGLTGGTADESDDADATTGSATVSAYAFYSALSGTDPLQPTAYCGRTKLGPARLWRRVSFTLGFDDTDDSSVARGGDPIVAGTKAMLWSKRDVCDADFSKVQSALEGATKRFSQLSIRIQDALYTRYTAGQLKGVAGGLDRTAFLNTLVEPATFETVLTELGDGAEELVSMEEVGEFVRLDDAARKEIDDFRRQPQLAASFTARQRRDGEADEYRAQAVFDYGLNDRLALTMNASYELRNATVNEDQGGRLAAALQFEPYRDPLVGPKPLRISLGGEGKWMEGMGPAYRGQLKVNLPIPKLTWLSGVEIPISVSIANRTELVDEEEVRGLIGFTVDTSQLLAAMRP